MPSLSPEQKHEVRLILSIGCARDTAARYAGCCVEDVNTAVMQDAAFARDVARAEASIELSHMRTVQQATRDERHWRASVWWLERRAPERYGRRNADAISLAELKRLLNELCDAVMQQVQSPTDRKNLLKRLEQLADEHEAADFGSTPHSRRNKQGALPKQPEESPS